MLTCYISLYKVDLTKHPCLSLMKGDITTKQKGENTLLLLFYYCHNENPADYSNDGENEVMADTFMINHNIATGLNILYLKVEKVLGHQHTE